MKDMADQEFFDDALEAQVKAAFADVEPSEEARVRMLANLLAAEAKASVASALASKNAGSEAKAEKTAEARVVSAPASGTEAVVETEVEARVQTEIQPEAKTQIQAEIEAKAEKTTEAVSVEDAAEIVAAARAAAPKPKRIIRPWQIAVPAAAVLALVAVVVVTGPVMGSLSLDPSAKQTLAPQARDYAAEQPKESDIMADEAVIANEAAVAEDAAMAEDVAAPDVAATEDASVVDEATLTEAEGLGAAEKQAMPSASNSGSGTTNWAQDFPTVVLDDGTLLTISSTTAVPADRVGTKVGDATAQNSTGTASVACEVFYEGESTDSFLVSYMGEELYFAAKEK